MNPRDYPIFANVPLGDYSKVMDFKPRKTEYRKLNGELNIHQSPVIKAGFGYSPEVLSMKG